MASTDTTEVIRAAEAAIQEIRTYNLYAGTISVEPGSGGWRYDHTTGDFTLPVLPRIQLSAFSRPAAFLAWAEHLCPERIRVERRELDTCLHFWRDRDGLTWNVNGSVRRPPSGSHLPGITVDWSRQPSGRRGNDAWISLDDLRVALTELGVVEAPVGVGSDG